MTAISELRDLSKNNINLIKIIESIFPNKKTKYIEMISRFIKDDISDIIDETNFGDIDTENLNMLEKHYLSLLIDKVLNDEEIGDLTLFCNKCEDNAVSGIDFQTVELKEVNEKIKILKDVEEFKRLEKQVLKIYEDDQWLVVMPMTFEASMKYGSNTKWCTTEEDSPDTFEGYCRDGILIYIIDRKNNVKHAVYHEKSEKNPGFSNITLWDAEDNSVEIFLSDIPSFILYAVKEFLLINEETTTQKMIVKYLNKTLDEKILTSNYNRNYITVEGSVYQR